LTLWGQTPIAPSFALVSAVLVGLMLALPAAQPATQPLTPEQAAMMRRALDGVARDEETRLHFACTLERRSYRVNAIGKVSNGDVRTYDVRPSALEPRRLAQRLVSVNGVPLSPEDQRREREREEREAARRQRELASETPAQRAIRTDREAEHADLLRRRLADVERVFRFEAAGREMIDGARLFLTTMTPRQDAQTQSDVGKHLKKLRGRVWFDEAAAQIARVEVETIGDLTFGWGMIGRVGTGSRMLYRRAPVANGTWLPVEARFTGSGRTLMLLPFQLETWSKYGDYRTAPPAAAVGHSPPGS
jgi:hypothetical protein